MHIWQCYYADSVKPVSVQEFLDLGEPQGFPNIIVFSRFILPGPIQDVSLFKYTMCNILHTTLNLKGP